MGWSPSSAATANRPAHGRFPPRFHPDRGVAVVPTLALGAGNSYTAHCPFDLSDPRGNSAGGSMCARLILWTGLLSGLFMAGPLPAQRRPTAAPPPLLDPTQFAALRHRYIGPVGNRVSAVAGVPGDFNTYYAGAASGGIWKTVDAGIHWQPIFDDQPVQSIGALAVAPSDPNLV